MYESVIQCIYGRAINRITKGDKRLGMQFRHLQNGPLVQMDTQAVKATISNAMLIADNLRTRYESKRHGGYNIYQDDKICITLDTYFPNLYVSIRDGDRAVSVVVHNGSGWTQEYHPGTWESYINNELAPKALAAQTVRKQAEKKRLEDERAAKFRPICDAHIFNQEVA